MSLNELESQRIARQLILDGERSQEQRNIIGQFATPYDLALDITRVALSYVPDAKRCLEPACGTGSFVSAALACNSELAITAIEKDVDYFEVANSLWSSDSVSVINDDFLEYSKDSESSFDVLLSNPHILDITILIRNLKTSTGLLRSLLRAKSCPNSPAFMRILYCAALTC